MSGRSYGKRKRLKPKPITRIIFYIICLVLLFSFCENAVSRLPSEYIAQNTRNYANTQINKIIENELEIIENTYKINTTDDNKISYMEIKSSDILKIKLKLSQRINEEINGSKITFIPIGSLLNFNLLSGFGFSVPVNIDYVGSAQVSIKTSLLETGINQSVYSLSAIVDLQVSSLSVKNQDKISILSEYPLCEVYIAGEVPNYKGLC